MTATAVTNKKEQEAKADMLLKKELSEQSSYQMFTPNYKLDKNLVFENLVKELTLDIKKRAALNMVQQYENGEEES